MPDPTGLLSAVAQNAMGWVGAALLGAVVATVALVLLCRQSIHLRFTQPGRLDAELPAAIILFDGDKVADASAAARDLLRGWGEDGLSLQGFASMLAPIFGPDLLDRLRRLGEGERLHMVSEDGLTQIEAEVFDGAHRIQIHGIDGDAGLPLRLRLDEALQELARMNTVLEHMPVPAWFTADDGTVSWANRPFLDLADRRRAAIRPDLDPQYICALWPEPDAVAIDVHLGPDEKRRVRVEIPEASGPGEVPVAHPYDVASVGLDGEAVHFALDARPLVEAQTARAALVSRLSLAFALLPCGVGVFDRDRRLAQFNPAFTDRIGLAAGLASERPTLTRVLGALDGGPEDGIGQQPGDETLAQVMERHLLSRGSPVLWRRTDGQAIRMAARALPDGALLLTLDDAPEDASHLPGADAAEALRDAIRLQDHPTLVLDLEGRIVAMSASYERGVASLRPVEDVPTRIEDELSVWDRRWSTGPLRDLLDARPRTTVRLALAPRQPTAPGARMQVQPLTGGGVMLTWLAGWPPMQAAQAPVGLTTRLGAMGARQAQLASAGRRPPVEVVTHADGVTERWGRLSDSPADADSEGQDDARFAKASTGVPSSPAPMFRSSRTMTPDAHVRLAMRDAPVEIV